MAMTVLGASVDLHAGGADLRFPHHAYEAAQAEAVSGVTPFARAWLHVGTVGIDGAKMAKSTGNLVLVSDVLAEHRPAALRLLLLDRRWNQSWDYSAELLGAAESRVDELYAAAGRPETGTAAEAEVSAALLDDLDVPRALAVAVEAGGSAARAAVRLLGLPA
jgi:cysteinyl-tRNA synthetase